MSAYTVTVNGESYTVHLKGRRGSMLTFSIEDREHTVSVDSTERHRNDTVTITLLPRGSTQRSASSSIPTLAPEIKAPLPGIISDVKVAQGDRVPAGATLVVIEAMKMENPIKTPADVIVTNVHVSKGQEVAHGALLVSIEPV